MSSYKQLNKADVTTVDYSANKRWNLFSISGSTDVSPDFIVYKGTNITGTFNPNDPSVDPITFNQYERLVYNSINHLFYQSFSGSLDTGSLMFNINTYQSASQQHPTNSYFNYNDNPLLIKQFPTGAGDGIRVLSINQDIYGSKILPNSFVITSSAYRIKDDGYGNLYDISGVGDDYIDLYYLTYALANGYFDDLTPGVGIQFVGNIFYAHGIAVVTSPDYQEAFPLPPLAVNNTARFESTTTSRTISILSNDTARTGILNTGSVILSGSNSSYYTVNSNGTITLTGSAPIGNYNVYYAVNNTFNNGTGSLISNYALVNVDVIFPTSSCLLYAFSGSIMGTEIAYVTCSDTILISEKIDVANVTRCVNNSYPVPYVVAGSGTINLISTCS